LEKNGDNMNMKNGDIIIVKWVSKYDKLKIWESVFTSEITYLDFICTRDVIVISEERKSNVYGQMAERINARKSRREVI
tara:strand:+ start:1809 stop:2045 length:237 start_codon:yes stop_codon:yes gene_type:complete